MALVLHTVLSLPLMYMTLLNTIFFLFAHPLTPMDIDLLSKVTQLFNELTGQFTSSTQNPLDDYSTLIHIKEIKILLFPFPAWQEFVIGDFSGPHPAIVLSLVPSRT